MANYLTPRIAVLSVAYFIIAVILLLLVDIGVYYFLNDFVFTILNWFNGLNIFFKLLILFLGGLTVFIFVLQLTQRISSLIGGTIFDRLPQNLFTIVSTFIISIANAIFNIIWLWRIPSHYDFWIVLELIILSFFLWTLSAIVMPAKEQMKEYKRDSLHSQI